MARKVAEHTNRADGEHSVSPWNASPRRWRETLSSTLRDRAQTRGEAVSSLGGVGEETVRASHWSSSSKA